MIRYRLPLIAFLVLALAACAEHQGTLAELRQVEIVVDNAKPADSLDKAIESYENFLASTDATPMTPDAIRRLADLKVEKEFGSLPEAEPEPRKPARQGAAPGKTAVKAEPAKSSPSKPADATSTSGTPVNGGQPPEVDLERVGAKEAIALYQKLLKDFPNYEKKDQVLYQLSRAYEEQGQVEEAMQVMARIVKEFPNSPYIDQVQFRRGEYYFARRNYREAEAAYGGVVAVGDKSDYYFQALYKQGWSLYKQDRFDEGLHRYFALLDHRKVNGYDFSKIGDDPDGKQVTDTLRIISQSFSSLGGVQAVNDYFAEHGRRTYEDTVYANLAEYYITKQRYNDAVATYAAFIKRQSNHRQAPLFALRIIEIHQLSRFPTLVIEAKRDYVESYGFGTDYWKYFNPDKRPDVVAGLKVNQIDLANHYHALYRDKRFASDKAINLEESLRWYREFLASFPRDQQTPMMNYQLAELLLENNAYAEAAVEYEKVAYVFPNFKEADKAGYAAVYAWREHLKLVDDDEKEQVRRDIIRVSIKFAETYTRHEKAAIVMSAAVEDLYALKEFKEASKAGRSLLKRFPKAPGDLRLAAWLVVAHSSFELADYRTAEEAYNEVLKLLPADDKRRPGLTDNLVASIYKQGEAENQRQNFKKAAEHFLRVATVAPASPLRPTADFDGAIALIKVEEWEGAARVLTGFRSSFPKHELQPEVTKRLAFVYRENGKFALAAVEFERIEAESSDPELRKEALLTAAELYEQVSDRDHAVAVYRRYVDTFPEPVVVNIETRSKLAALYEKLGQTEPWHAELRQIVSLEAKAGSARNERTRQLAASAALVLARRDYDACIAVRLAMPFEANLQKKQELMKQATDAYTKLFDYEIGDVTAEAIYHLAEIYADFSAALLESERPGDLSPLELEQYELAIEEQAYPFEEKAIEMHQSNLELMSRDIYNDWIERSLAKLARIIPARYGKKEVANRALAPLSGIYFENLALRPAPVPVPVQPTEAPAVKKGGNP